MIKDKTEFQKPIKCTLTRIIDEYNDEEFYNSFNTYNSKKILKDYVYVQQKKQIA